MGHRVALLHTSPPAIAPLMLYLGTHAPELEITNLLEDGILRFFSAGDYTAAEARFRDLLGIARSVYRADAAMITCSSTPRRLVRNLAEGSRIPVLKIDDPMATRAVRAGRRIGVAITFRPTLEPTTRLLNETAAEAGAAIELVPAIVSEAYEALLGGRPERHDELLLAAIDELVSAPVDAVVLAQVSMARLLPKLEGRYAVPVLSSLETSLEALREALGERARILE